MEGVYWINMNEASNGQQSIVNTVKNLGVPYKMAREFID
jgi:hypothetical protein